MLRDERAARKIWNQAAGDSLQLPHKPGGRQSEGQHHHLIPAQRPLNAIGKPDSVGVFRVHRRADDHPNRATEVQHLATLAEDFDQRHDRGPRTQSRSRQANGGQRIG